MKELGRLALRAADLGERVKLKEPPGLHLPTMSDQATTGAKQTISLLKANSNATIEATIEAISPTRDVSTQRGPGRVADATLKDDSGSIQMSLWNQDIERFKVGQRIKIHDGWVKEWKGKLQIGLGRSGRVEVL